MPEAQRAAAGPVRAPGKSRGRVIIRLQAPPDSIIELMVSDDGIGLRDGLDVSRAKTLSLQLVYALATQLDGEVDIYTKTGVAFRITFRDPGVG